MVFLQSIQSHSSFIKASMRLYAKRYQAISQFIYSLETLEKELHIVPSFTKPYKNPTFKQFQNLLMTWKYIEREPFLRSWLHKYFLLFLYLFTHYSLQELQCTCERNTCGKSCEKCCPLFNQKPWKPGTYVEGNVCEGMVTIR